MIIEEGTIRAAFRKHGELYASKKVWSVPYHLECWRCADLAFGGARPEAFVWLYKELRRRWQVFRGPNGTHWSQKSAFQKMAELDPVWRTRSLSSLRPADMADLWTVLTAMSEIKNVKVGASVVAVSKFLHFWNPRLFVIVDDAVVWRWVFQHSWLREPVLELRQAWIGSGESDQSPLPSGACDLRTYAVILLWSAELIRRNPLIPTCFAEHVRSLAEGPTEDIPLETYEAAAAEWLLLGLVDLPPSGVSL